MLISDCPLYSSLQYILNEKEVKIKTELWLLQNADYLKEQKGERFKILAFFTDRLSCGYGRVGESLKLVLIFQDIGKTLD